MKENLKNQTGITLVALVITIIILLILATVTIRIVLSEGIIKREQNATESYNSAQHNELAQLDDVEARLSQYEKHWWDLSDAEQAELNTLLLNEELIAYSTSASGDKVIQYFWEEQENGIIRAINVWNAPTGTGITFFIELSGSIANELYAETELKEIQMKKWYLSTDSDPIPVSEYHGSCPVSLNDFEGGTLHMEDFVKRIIASFDN